MPRAQPGRERLAVHARELALKPRLPVLPQYPRSLLPRLEQARRTALDHHVYRSSRLGTRVLITGSWYKTRRRPWRRDDTGLLSRNRPFVRRVDIGHIARGDR